MKLMVHNWLYGAIMGYTLRCQQTWQAMGHTLTKCRFVCSCEDHRTQQDFPAIHVEFQRVEVKLVLVGGFSPRKYTDHLWSPSPNISRELSWRPHHISIIYIYHTVLIFWWLTPHTVYGRISTFIVACGLPTARCYQQFNMISFVYNAPGKSIDIHIPTI